MKVSMIARRVAAKLLRSERSVDTALADATALFAETLEAQKMLKLHGSYTAEAQAGLLKAMSLISEARTEILAVHASMATAQKDLGDRTVMVGFGEKTMSAPAGAELVVLDDARTAS